MDYTIGYLVSLKFLHLDHNRICRINCAICYCIGRDWKSRKIKSILVTVPTSRPIRTLDRLQSHQNAALETLRGSLPKPTRYRTQQGAGTTKNCSSTKKVTNNLPRKLPVVITSCVRDKCHPKSSGQQSLPIMRGNCQWGLIKSVEAKRFFTSTNALYLSHDAISCRQSFRAASKSKFDCVSWF